MPTAADFGLRILTGTKEATVIRCQAAEGKLSIDRRESGRVEFHRHFAGVQEAPVRLVEGRLSLRLFLDTSSIEVFAAGGETVLTDLIFPAAGGRRCEVFAAPNSEAPRVRSLEVWELRSAW